MARGKRWTEAENKLLLEMIREGMSVQQIYDSGKFPNRSFNALQHQFKQLKKLSSDDYAGKKKISFVGKIGEAEIVDLESVVKRFVDAFNKICALDKYNKQDLERFRIIFSAARVYFDLYFKLQSFEEVKARVERVEKLVEQLATEKKAEASRREN
jgi:hypothetical protein